MREPLFVKQNAEKWKSFEQAPTADPDEVAERFIKITDDLAYAKTFYPKSKTTEYLNGLAAQLHQTIQVMSELRRINRRAISSHNIKDACGRLVR